MMSMMSMMSVTRMMSMQRPCPIAQSTQYSTLMSSSTAHAPLYTPMSRSTNSCPAQHAHVQPISSIRPAHWQITRTCRSTRPWAHAQFSQPNATLLPSQPSAYSLPLITPTHHSYSSLLLIAPTHHSCSSLLLITPTHHSYSSPLLITTTQHSYPTLLVITPQATLSLLLITPTHHPFTAHSLPIRCLFAASTLSTHSQCTADSLPAHCPFNVLSLVPFVLRIGP
jgi:hypothetical protein